MAAGGRNFIEVTAPGLVLVPYPNGVHLDKGETLVEISLTRDEGGRIMNSKESRTAAVCSSLVSVCCVLRVSIDASPIGRI